MLPPAAESTAHIRFLSDLRFAVRSLRRQPLFALMVVAILAVAVAANTAIFSLVNGLFLEPLPFPDAARVVDLNEQAPRWNLERVSVAYPDIVAWRAENRTVYGIVPWDDRSCNLSSDAGTQRVTGIAVGHNVAEVVGYEPMLGRDFAEADDRPGTERVVFLAHGLWQRQFGGDPDVLGQTLGTLVAGEVALALVLLLVAGLLIKASDRVQQVDPGYRPQNVLMFRV